MELDIVDDRSVSASRVHSGFVMNLFSERYSIDSVPISLRGSKINVDIDWFGSNGDVVDCEHYLVRIRTLSGGELVFQGEGAQH